MGSPQGRAPSNEFQSRLNRVAKQRAPIDAAKPQVDLLPDWKANFKQPMTIVAAVLVGMQAVLVARLLRFHLMGGTLAGDNPDIAMIIDVGVAIAFSFPIIFFLNLRGHKFKAAQVAGIVLMFGVMHNFVHAAPGVFGLLFSEEWTEDIVTYSEPGSVYVRGNYITVLPSGEDVADEPKKPELPKVRRLG